MQKAVFSLSPASAQKRNTNYFVKVAQLVIHLKIMVFLIDYLRITYDSLRLLVWRPQFGNA